MIELTGVKKYYQVGPVEVRALDGVDLSVAAGEFDFRTGSQILELLYAQAAGERAVLVVTHNREISRMADRVVELSSGEIISDGPPAGGKTALAELHW